MGAKASTTKTTVSHNVILRADKECKHSVRYSVDGKVKNPLVTSIYLMRPYCETMGDTIRVTVEGVTL